MKKKLAIFTVAVGFFTLCNVILYTRKLRADEMVSFWRWSITTAEANVKNNNNNYSSAYLADSQQQQRESNRTSAAAAAAAVATQAYPLPYSVISVGQKQRVLSSIVQQRETTTTEPTTNETNSTNVFKSNTNNVKLISVSPTFHVDGNNRNTGVVTRPSTVSSTLTTITGSSTTTSYSSSSWSLIEAIMNQTYRYNVNDSTACVEVSSTLPQGNVSVTFNISLIDEQYGLDSFHGGGGGDGSNTMSIWPTIDNSDIKSNISNETSQMSPFPSKSTYHVSSKPPEGIVTKPSTLTAKKGLSPLNEHPFSYLVNVNDLCRGSRTNLTLVILVTTAIGHAAHRRAIRDTWGGMAKSLSDVRLAFLMGKPENPADEGNILREALQNADIVQEDFVDTYKNLTLKTVMLLKWANTYCSNSRYVMKTDDDMFVNVPNLLKYLRSLRYNKGQLLGRLVRGARPLRTRSSKYYVPVSEYKDRIYPDYLSGTAYVMSSDVVPRLYSTSRTTPIFFFEDVFVTGICAKKAKVVRRNHAGFVYYKRPVKGCAYLRAITGHDNTPNDLRKIWRELQRKNFKC